MSGQQVGLLIHAKAGRAAVLDQWIMDKENCRLITYWPARSMLTHFRLTNFEEIRDAHRPSIKKSVTVIPGCAAPLLSLVSTL